MTNRHLLVIAHVIDHIVDHDQFALEWHIASIERFLQILFRRVPAAPLFLLFGRGRDQLVLVQMPAFAGALSCDGLGPQLLAHLVEAGYIELAETFYRPEPASAGRVAQIFAVIDGSAEHALPRHVDDMDTVGRPVAIICAGDERLESWHFSAAHGVE